MNGSRTLTAHRWKRLGTTIPAALIGLGLPLVLASPASALPCDKTFMAAPGSWNTTTNWTPTGVPSAAETACIPSGGDALVVGGTAVGAIQVDAGGKVTVQGNSSQGTAVLTLTNASTNAGTVELTAIDAGWNATLAGAALASSGSLTTTGLTGGNRYINVPLTNTGTVTIDRTTFVDAAVGAVNSGAWTVTAANSFSVDEPGASFTQNAGGTLTVDGSATFTNDTTFTFNGGSLPTGDPYLFGNSGTPTSLVFGPTATAGVGTGFRLGQNTDIAGDIPTNASITIQGNASQGNAVTSIAASLINKGTITLDSSGGGYNSTLDGASLQNNLGATIRTSPGAGGNRHLHANITNLGLVDVEAPTVVSAASVAHTNSKTWTIDPSGSLSFSGGGSSFTQSAGSLTIDGSMTMQSLTTFVMNAGNIPTGDVYLHGPQANPADLVFGVGATAVAGSGFRLGNYVDLTGDIPTNATVTVHGNGAQGHAHANMTAPLTNNGTIDMTSDGGGWWAYLEGAALTNNGSITTLPGTGGERLLNLNLTNNGTVTMNGTSRTDAGSHANNGTWTVAGGSFTMNTAASEFTQNAGTLTVTGPMTMTADSTFTHNGGSLPTGDVLLHGPTGNRPDLVFGPTATAGAGTGFRLGNYVDLAGDIPVNATVTVHGNGAQGHAHTNVAAALTNNGTIVMTSEGGGWWAYLEGAAVTNEGTISTLGGTGGERPINTPLTNSGTISISGPTRVETAVVHSNDTGGAISIVPSGSYSLTSGSGSTFLQNEGTLAVLGSMTINSSTTFQFFKGAMPNGDPIVNTGTLEILPGAATSGKGTGVRMVGASTFVGSTIPAKFGFSIQGNGSQGHANTTATAATVTNFGTIFMTSTGGGWGATFTGTNLVNESVLRAARGSGGVRNFAANVTNKRTFDLLDKPFVATVTGSYTQTGNGELKVRAFSNNNTTRLTVTGTATLDDTLTIVTAYTPAVGDVQTFVSAGSVVGTFNSVNGLDPPGATFWNISYPGTTVSVTAVP